MDRDIFLIGCTHYNHYNIINYCNRIDPDTGNKFTSSKKMDEVLISNHNKTVKGLYINLGDFCFGNANNWREILSRLYYEESLLIQGNHDKEKQQDILNSGFNKIFRKYWLYYHGYNILLTHKPCITESVFKEIDGGNPNPGYDIRKSYTLISQTEYDKMNLNIHAHIHNNPREQLNKTGKHFNASADVLNFTPIHINDILFKMFGIKI